MENMVSLKQSHEVMAKLGTKADWSRVSSGVAQAIIENPNIGEEFTRYLLNLGSVVVVTTDGIEIPESGRIHVVAVPVNESRDWIKAVKAAGPNTDKGWDIWRMGDQYPPSKTGSGLKKVLLVNFGKYMNGRAAALWGKSQKLVPITPRTGFAIGEHCPNLPKDLGMDPMGVISLKECSFQGRPNVTDVWFDRSERGAGHLWLDDEFSDGYWFGFVRKSK
ncbi:MAG: hypothetical protein HYW89_00555 [Candidatus Sungiibacteriota bacterium]|uniref:Uncharacterized protein n=1 Tax=Candidatus Sungiibacteriota bacterium TaxID=2750080 RepID=A0A7T5RJS6_9BACT|nr:MAG: hypothetical protein HYW89_00555 [Candidatus Sungbacteria bacterium]